MKIFVAVLTGLLIGAAGGLGIFYHNEIKNFKAAEWTNPPILVDCTHGSLSVERLNESIKFWDALGHKIGFAETNPPAGVCLQDHIHGFIIIKNADLEWPTLGRPQRKGNLSGEISSAYIELSFGDANAPRLLEHELGHAFGYKHLDIDGHIMHSIYDYSGYRFWD